MPRRYSGQTLKHVERLLKGGVSYRETARQTGTHARTIAIYFPGYGKRAAPAQQFYLSPEARAQAEAIGEEGGSIADIVRATGLNRAYVRANYPQYAYTPEQTGYFTNAVRKIRGTS